MIKLSANLGFLWTELSLPDAIHAAKHSGFDAVEFHAPTASSDEVKTALLATQLPILSLNTGKGNQQGDNGLAAVIGRETEARELIDEAIKFAAKIDCPHVHVMAGTSDKGADANACFLNNLAYACEEALKHQITILIEPLNSHDAPEYHFSTLDEALAILAALTQTNIKIMFDCYHMQRVHGAIVPLYAQAKAHIGHVQFAAVPDRAEPDHGEVDYSTILPALIAEGYDGYFGAEYRPSGDNVEAGLSWIDAIKLG